MSDPRHRPGMPIPGSEGKITASSIRDALGLPGGKPPEPVAAPLSPAQARAKAEGKPIPPGDDTYERIVVAGGRDAFELFGGDPAKLPVGEEAKLGPPKSRPVRRRSDEGAAINGPTPEESAAEAARQAEEIRQETHAQLDRSKARVLAAIEYGSAEERENARVDGESAVSLTRKVKEKIGL